MYEPQLKIAEQQLGTELDKEKREQGQPPQKQREAPEELRYESEKLADNDLGYKAASWQTQYQREKIEVSEGTDSCRGPNEGEPSWVAADTQGEPTLDAADAQGVPTIDLTQSEENKVAADTHKVRSSRSTLPYDDHEEHETTEFSVKPSFGVGRHTSNGSVSRYTLVFSEPSNKNDVHENDAGGTEIAAVPAKSLPSSFRASTAAAGSSTGAASGGSSGFSLGATKSAAPVQPASATVKNSADGMSAANGQAASSELPSMADMFKPKPGEWDCPTCKTRNKPTATIRCMACEEAKPGAPAQAAVGGSAGGATFSFGTKAAAAASSSVAPAGGSGLSSGGFGASSAAPQSAPAVSGSFSFVAQDEAAAAQDEPQLDRICAMFDAFRAELEEQLRSLSQEVPKLVQNSGVS
jgi:hypothetical protein